MLQTLKQKKFIGFAAADRPAGAPCGRGDTCGSDDRKTSRCSVFCGLSEFPARSSPGGGAGNRAAAAVAGETLNAAKHNHEIDGSMTRKAIRARKSYGIKKRSCSESGSFMRANSSQRPKTAAGDAAKAARSKRGSERRGKRAQGDAVSCS